MILNRMKRLKDLFRYKYTYADAPLKSIVYIKKQLDCDRQLARYEEMLVAANRNGKNWQIGLHNSYGVNLNAIRTVPHRTGHGRGWLERPKT
jgi:hypothetical protein